jgi:hypothetical protein
MRTLITGIALITLLIACNQIETGQKNPIHEAEVEEILQTADYTYLKVSENDSILWLAARKMEIKKGEKVFYKDTDGFMMLDFESKELSRKFDKVMFMNNLYTDEQQALKGEGTEESHNSMMQSMDPSANGNYHQQNQKIVIAKDEVSVEKAKDELTISELFSNKDKYVEKIVRIKGKVVKFSDSIMDRNWVHMQDGTESDGKFDLTITTMDEVKVGDVVTFEGKIALNKDFGYGYSYEIIMEEAHKK